MGDLGSGWQGSSAPTVESLRKLISRNSNAWNSATKAIRSQWRRLSFRPEVEKGRAALTGCWAKI